MRPNSELAKNLVVRINPQMYDFLSEQALLEETSVSDIVRGLIRKYKRKTKGR